MLCFLEPVEASAEVEYPERSVNAGTVSVKVLEVVFVVVLGVLLRRRKQEVEAERARLELQESVAPL